MTHREPCGLPFGLYLFDEYIFPRGLMQLAVAVKRQLAGGWRTPAASAALNDIGNRRAWEELQQLNPDTWYDRVVYRKGRRSYFLKADQVFFGDPSEIDSVWRERLCSALRLTQDSQARILEFGCSHGKNLFWLKRNYPKLSVYGVDISNEAVTLGRRLSDHFEMEVTFTTLTDHRLPFPDAHFDVAFTHMCLEQCPYTYKEIIQELLRVTKTRIAFFEPLNELYPISILGLFGRLHGFYHNYSKGVYSYLKRVATVSQAERLQWTGNPVNNTCLVVVERPVESGR